MPNKPTLYIAVDMTRGILKVHKPVGLECEIEILDLDEPDAPGLKARGLEHPEDESNRLERDTANYETETHYDGI